MVYETLRVTFESISKSFKQRLVLPVPEAAETTIGIPRRFDCGSSLDILNLLPHAL